MHEKLGLRDAIGKRARRREELAVCCSCHAVRSPCNRIDWRREATLL